ncbi:MAG: hypothetical protein EOO10_22005 [Chitinophagaceae bacterium]|nr:MAG: hypothetical protein EOO10_22005 [Chitinophagaceae bacterium]
MLLLLSGLNLFGQVQQGLEHRRELSREKCLNLLKSIAGDWLKDSLSKNDFRSQFGWDYMDRLDSLRGAKWSEVSAYLGRPDFVRKNRAFIKAPDTQTDSTGRGDFFYILSNLPRTEAMLRQLGTVLLYIKVENNLIVYFSIRQNDG